MVIRTLGSSMNLSFHNLVLIKIIPHLMLDFFVKLQFIKIIINL